jgi:hypothetical protein
MSFFIILTIMISAGVLGGFVNYLMPANKKADGKTVRGWINCIVLGIGATVLVPLFLEIAQSKLLDNIHMGWNWQPDSCDLTKINADASNDSANPCVPVKTYLLFAAYCFLAAAAGFRFINNLLDSVLKDKQIADLKEKKGIVEKEKNKIEKVNEKLDAQNKFEAKIDEDRAIRASMVKAVGSPEMVEKIVRPQIGPVTHPDDPQKGRFGGQAENNGRRLAATVKKSKVPGYYNVTVWVESTDIGKPLDSDVIFYLHDSFRPSVYTITTDEFVEGKALDDEIIAYGAFTVGAVTDNGSTLLELDLSQNQEYPKEFRER